MVSTRQENELENSFYRPGRLHIFLGMCPGVGKTYAMLQAGRQRVAEGRDVLVGIVETHGRIETAALLEGLTVLPRKEVEHRGLVVAELDLDAVLLRRPQIVLVDELAHSQVEGSRHAKRYQDVLELLDAGLDVYTTLNVQHIESQVDIVRQITGIEIRETVPDSILDRAHEIQLIDLGVEKLLERLREGKVYLGERATRATEGFFKEGNLLALRELALRFTAEQVDRDLEDIRRARRDSGPWKTNARLLVGVGPSPHAESLIRWTRRAAARLNCPWIVAWVEGSRDLEAGEEKRLAEALALGRKLGAEVVSITGESVPRALLELARERNVTQIVIGKSDRRWSWLPSPSDRIVRESGDIDVCLVRPVAAGTQRAVERGSSGPVSDSVIAEYSASLALLFGVASLSWAILPYTGYLFSALAILLSIVLSALRFRRGPVLAMATLGALSWNFFFIPPRFTFHITKAEDGIMFALFFVVAISMGSLTSRLRTREVAERRRARQTDALLRVTQSAALTAEPEKGLAEALRIINEVLGAESALFVRGDDGGLPEAAHPASTLPTSTKERAVALWCYENRHAAGRHTDTLPESDVTWFPLQTATANLGAFGLRFSEKETLDFPTRQRIEAFALQLALVLEKEHFLRALNEAEVSSRSADLHRVLFDSVSHELKTPIAVIRGALDGLNPGDPSVAEIDLAARRLQRVVEGFLEMTRLESDATQIGPDWCEIGDVLHTAMEPVKNELAGRRVTIVGSESLPLLHLDIRLFGQAFANVLHNAILHTPSSSPIEIGVHLVGGCLLLTVRDHGPGIASGEAIKIFQKFHRSPGARAGGTGLGLAIARGMMRVMGGEISVRNHEEGGAEFSLRLPVKTRHA